jgi:hypothetical protein
MNKIFTRTGYCFACEKAGRPRNGGNWFVAYGSSSEVVRLHSAKLLGKNGFTPHIYVFIHIIKDKVYYARLCAVTGCGAYFTKEYGVRSVIIDNTKWDFCIASVSDWNALVSLKDTGLEI